MQAVQPTKVLGVFSLVMINVIAVDNLRSLPIGAEYGWSLIFYYLLACLVFFIPSALISAELATGWPNTGGIYVWIREAFGPRMAFVVVWLQWVYNIVWYPTILSFIASTLAYWINPALIEEKYFMLGAILGLFWLSTVVNCMGMRVSSWISTIAALVGTIAPMLLIIVLGGLWVLQGNPVQMDVSVHSFWPDLTSANNLAFFSAILYGLIGMEMSGVHAEEVENPRYAYPRALLISAIIIVVTLVLASLAIALVVPKDQLNVVVGLTQAFDVFFQAFHMEWMNPIITALIILGGLGGVAAWIIGPTKSLFAASADGSVPPLFCKTNSAGVPVNILIVQGLIFTLLCSAFLLMPSVRSSYWLLTAMSAQLALLVYVVLFAAFIRLRYSHKATDRSYQVPGGNAAAWLVGGMGIVACVVTIGLGFLPPTQVPVGKTFNYELLLILGGLGLIVPPWIIYALRRPDWAGKAAGILLE